MEKTEVVQIVRETLDQVMPQITSILQAQQVAGELLSTELMPNTHIEVTGIKFQPYDQMVADLFKKDPDNKVMAIHAAIGMAGESGELREADTFKNAIEEIGDFKFYTVAMRQRLSPMAYGSGSNIRQTSEVSESQYGRPTHATVVDNLHILSCRLLDIAKKSWVYGRELKEYEIRIHLELLDINLDYLVREFYGTSWEHVLHENQMKLLVKRYASGSYSDAQALARADKS